MSEPLPPPRPPSPFDAPPAVGPSGAPAVGPPSEARPARPAVRIPAIMLLAGGIVMIIGTFLPWVTGNGISLDGWELGDLNSEGSDAAVFVVLGVILSGLGVALAAAGRLLALAIVAVIIAAMASIAAFVDVTDDDGLALFGLEIAAGLWIILVAALVSLAGAIWALAVRRT